MAKISASKGVKTAAPKSIKTAKSAIPKVKSVAPRVGRSPRMPKKSLPVIKKTKSVKTNRLAARTPSSNKKIKSVQKKTLSKDYLRSRAVGQATQIIFR